MNFKTLLLITLFAAPAFAKQADALTTAQFEQNESELIVLTPGRPRFAPVYKK